MGLDIAIDELYATGWTTLDSTRCKRHSDGRAYPTVERVRKELESLGVTLTVRHVQLFDCYRAEWSDDQGAMKGSVVGRTEEEAAVYALACARRSCELATA